LGPALASAVADPVPAVFGASDAGGKGFSFLPSQVSVSAGRLRFARKNLNEVVLGSVRNGGSWRANLSSREIDGLFDWRAALPGQPVGALSARLTRLEIPPDQVEEFESLLDHLPQVLPGLD